MPYKRKDSKYWWVTFTDAAGRQRSQSTKTTDWREASTIEHSLRAEAVRVSNPHADKTFDDVLLAFLEEHNDERRRYAVQALIPYFSKRLIGSITAADIAEYKKSRGVSAGTMRRELGVFSAAINWCRRELGWNIENPVAGRAPAPPKGRLRWITRQQYQTLLDAVSVRTPYLRQYITLGVNTGMRSGEILGLEWPRVDLTAGLIYLDPEHQKSGQHGSVPLNAAAREALLIQARFRAEYCPGSPWVFCNRRGERIASIKKSFTTACKRINLDDFKPHDLRHTCAAWLVQAGVPLRTVAEILRHSSIATTMRYAHLAPENAAAGVQALDFDRSENVVSDEKKVPLMSVSGKT